MIAAQRRSERLVSSRLEALGHPPDYFARDALDALFQGAAGSEQRLRAGLAGALFLAETEDAPQVERLHVQRALEDAPAAPGRPLLASRRFWLSPWTALPLYLAAALLFLLPRQNERPAPPVAVPEEAARPSVAPPPVAVRQEAPRVVAADPIAKPRSAALPVAGIPEQVPPVVSIVIFRRSGQAAAELQALTAVLRQAGLQPSIMPAPPSSGPADPAVAYFYTEDRRLADRVAHLLDTTPNPRQQAAAWPRLVGRQAGTLPPPGSVEIRLP